MMKKTLAVIAATAVLAASTVTSFAEYDPNKVVTNDVASTKMISAPAFTINVNGAEIEAPAPFENEGTMMIPLRAITETLGFNVEWQGETATIILSKGPVYVTLNAHKDGYTFSKTAPMMLGVAPILIEGVTFVPSTFITEILGGAYKTDADGAIEIFDADSKDIALIDEINAEEKQLTVNDIVLGTVVLNIGEETLITDEEGKAVAFDELEVGNTLKITYSEMMTRSLPPQNAPYAIVVKSSSPAVTLPSDEAVAEANIGKVSEINSEENQITVNDPNKGEVILNIGENSKIYDAEGNEITLADVKADMELNIEYGDAMTMSIPPINNPKSVTVVPETEVAEAE